MTGQRAAADRRWWIEIPESTSSDSFIDEGRANLPDSAARGAVAEPLTTECFAARRRSTCCRG